MLNFDKNQLDDIIIDEETKLTYSEWKQRNTMKKDSTKVLKIIVIIMTILILLSLY